MSGPNLTPDLSSGDPSSQQPSLSQPGAQASAAPAPGPHSTLLRMIQGLAVGVGAFAHSAATQGREGGPADVQRFQAEQQREQAVSQESQLRAQTAQREQQEGDLRMKTMNAQLLMQQAAYHHALQMYPSEEKSANLKVLNDASDAVKEAMSEGFDVSDPGQAAIWRQMRENIIKIPFASGQSQKEVLSSATDAAERNGKDITNYVPVVSYTDGQHGSGGELILAPAQQLQQVQATPRQIAAGMAQMKATLSTATAALGADDPQVKALSGKIDTIQSVLDKGGKPSAYDFINLTGSTLGPLATRIAGEAQTEKINQQKADTLHAQQETDPEFQARAAGLKKTAEESAELPFVGKKTAAAESASLPFAGKKAAAEAAATQPYKVALANMEVPIREGVQNDEKARAEAEQYTKGYVERMSAINELKSAAGQAASGNVAAAKSALLRVAGISMPVGSKRLSPEAVYQLEHMGSDAQKWVGSLKNALTGDHWTAGMTQDVVNFADNEAAKARQQLSMGVHTLNAVRGTKIDPNAIFQAANLDQNYAQQVDSPGGGPSQQGTPQTLGSKYGPPVK